MVLFWNRKKIRFFVFYFRKPSCELFYWLSLKIGIQGVNKFLTMNILIYQQYRSVLRLRLGNVRKEDGVSNQICFNCGYFEPHLFLSLCTASNAWPILTRFVPNSASLYLLVCLEAQLYGCMCQFILNTFDSTVSEYSVCLGAWSLSCSTRWTSCRKTSAWRGSTWGRRRSSCLQSGRR